MKVKRLKKALSKTSRKATYSEVLRAARRGSAYAFAAGLGIWLPRTEAATLINLDSTSLPTGPLNTWANTGTVSGDFVSAGDTIPEVVSVDGVNAVALTNAPGTAGAAGTQYAGPATTAAVGGRAPRTVEAWIFDPEPTNQVEKSIFSFGRRANPNNFVLEHGASQEEGAVNTATANQSSGSNAGNGGGDIGWNGSQNVVLGRWTYIAATYDGTVLRVYSDGELRNSKVAILDTALTSQDGSTNTIFRVARQSINNAAASVSGIGVGPFYVGRIRVTDTNLTDAQILANFNSEKADFKLGDSDGDGLPDWWEIRHGLNPNSSTGADGASGDPDSDGATNLEEYNAGSDPQVADTDGDGINDGAELHRVNPVTSAPEPTDPTKADTDGDGLSDAVETGTGSGAGTNPTKADTDGDGYSDGLEVAKGTDPFNASSHPNPLVQLDATALAAGPLTTWTNNGTLSGNFAATQPTNAPSVELVDGVNAIHFRTIGGGGTNGQSYIGPAMPSQLGGANPKTIEAWVLDNVAQDELTVAAFGRRGGNPATGNNFELNMGQNDAYGAIAIWGAPDIGWNDNEVRGRWTHIVGTYDGTTTRVYVDGQLANAETIAIDTKLFAATAAGNATDSTTPLPIRVARQNNDTGGIDATGFGDITVAKVNMYDFALDAGSVKARFDEDKTNFNLGDTDGDGMPDWYEARCGLDKNTDDSAGDKDSDGLTNLQEYQLGTRADLADTDGDGVNDKNEVVRTDTQTGKPLGTNPLNKDTDGDTLSDKVETDTGTFVSITNTGTDPLLTDTDGDGFPDNTEILQGSNPLDPGSVPDPSPLINLVATNGFPSGTLNVWTNAGRLGGEFTAADGGGAFTNQMGAVSDFVGGVNCVTFNGGTYVGPAATQLTGNPAFSVDAWVYNPSFQDEETIISWGGRGGPAGSMAAFGYGNDQNGWGAMTHWGADLGWNNTEIAAAWTHIAYTYNPQTGDQLCYINGTLANSNNIGSLAIENLTSGGTPYAFRLGDEMEKDGTPSAGAGFHATMSVGELRVYSRVLSAGEVSSNFDAGKGVYGFLDSDGDGMPDNYERQYSFLNPNDPSDGAKDFDNDGLSNFEEYSNNTDPTNPDTDGDGLTDGDEVHTTFTNPANSDTDRDGLPDSTEIALGTDPFNPDSDADTFLDSLEVAYGTNPKDGTSTPDQSTPAPLVNLDATTLPVGSLPVWTNLNNLGWRFVASPSTNAPSVQMVDGTKGVVFDGTQYYTGPNMPTYLGGNSARTIEAWVWNPAAKAENFVLSWGHRGGNPDGSNCALSYGTDPAYGAIQFWGAFDSPWGTNTAQINQNVHVGQWSFIAFTYDPATSNKVAYLNGQPVLSATTPGPLATWVDDPTDKLNQQTPPVGRTNPIRIAAENGSSLAPTGDNATGAFSTLTMAKIRAYNTALTAQQIADQYNAEVAQFPGALEIKNVRVNTANGIIVFDWTPIAGKTYAVDANSDVGNSGGWAPVATGLTSGSYTNNNIGNAQEFFRLRQEN